MEELRKKLSNNYMVMTEYFNESFSFFKFLLKKEFIWFVMIILLSVTSQVFFEDITHITFPIYFFIFKLLIKKIIEIIEEKKSIRNRKVLGKMFLYFGSLLAFIIIIIIFVRNLSEIPSYSEMAIISLLFVISLFTYTFFFTYFEISYFSRDISMLEAFKYNLRIFKGQGLKRLFPLIFLIALTLIFSVFGSIVSIILLLIAFLISLTIFAKFAFIILYPITFLDFFFESVLLLVLLYLLISSCIIYLNVEYMYLNKQYEEITKETNIENSSQDNPKSINFIFRKSEEKDIDKIVEILEKAKIEIKKLGINQWQNGYPNRDVILSDIKNGNSYIIEDEEKIVATAALIFEKESPYSNISEGKWITDSDYSVIHRIAVDSELINRGYSSKLLKKLEEVSKEKLVYSIKIDTHEDNKPMQRLLEKNWYVYCGIIYLDKEPSIGEKRMAFEKVLEK